MLEGSPSGSDQLRAAIRARRSWTISFLDELCSIRSELGKEDSAQVVIEDRLVEMGMDVRYEHISLDSLNSDVDAGWPAELSVGKRVLMARSPGEPSGGLMLMFNIDIATPPKEALTDDGQNVRMHWNGEWLEGWAGLKSGAVCMCLALRVLNDVDGRHPEGLQIASVVEEETTGNGALFVLAVADQPSAALVSTPVGPLVCNAQVGLLRFTVDVLKDREEYAGANGIEALAEAIRSVAEETIADWVQPYVADFGTSLSDAGIDVAEVVSSTESRSARFSIRVGLPVDFDPDVARRRLVEALACRLGREAVTAFPSQMRGIGFAHKPESLPRLIDTAPAWSDVLKQDVPTGGLLTSGDVRFFARRGIPVTSFGPRIEGLHSMNERVLITDVENAALALALHLKRVLADPDNGRRSARLVM